MAHIYLEVASLNMQIRNLRTTGSEIAGVAFSVDGGEANLESLDKYIECIEALNEAFATFGSFLEKDADGFEAVRQQFISDDGFLSRTFGTANY